MRILVLSDTHSFCDDRMLYFASQSDEVWHAGDIGNLKVIDDLQSCCSTVRAVYGNIDSAEIRQSFSKELEFYCEGLKIIVRHIWQEMAETQAALENRLEEKGVGLFINGHSHIARITRSKSGKIVLMNPGACGRSGFHAVRTMIRLEIGNGKIQQTDLIELGPRSAKTV